MYEIFIFIVIFYHFPTIVYLYCFNNFQYYKIMLGTILYKPFGYSVYFLKVDSQK